MKFRGGKITLVLALSMCVLPQIAAAQSARFGCFQLTLGGGSQGSNGVAVDGNENVFVADPGNNAVKEILAAGGYLTVNTLARGFKGPTDVVVDGSGNVYVADF
jgi:hypothetical protein